MDCDMLMRDDIANLWKLRDDRYSVMVVKHNHVPRETVKFLGRTQSKYDKKYTIGGPYFEALRECEYSREWFAERDAMLRVTSRAIA